MNTAAQPEPAPRRADAPPPFSVGATGLSTTEPSTTEVVTGSDGGLLKRFGASPLIARVNAVSDVRARRVAALLLVVSFVLVVVAQWKPWFSLGPVGLDIGNTDRELRTIGAIEALYTLAIPYYIGWSLIVMTAGAAVFGGKRMRRTSAALAAGAVAGQLLIVLATWHDDGIGVFRELTLPGGGAMQSSRRSGIYFALAALLVIAIALVVALRGRIVPMPDDDDARTVLAPVTDESHKPKPRLGVRAGAPWVDSGEDLDDAPDHQAVVAEPDARGGTHHPVRSAPPPDHSMYMRPETRVNSPR